MEGIGLIALDVDGVLRNISTLLYECHKLAFSKYYPDGDWEKVIPNADDLWHFKGLGKYNHQTESIKAFRAMLNYKKKIVLGDVIKRIDAEQYIDSIVHTNITEKDDSVLEDMRNVYIDFFKSDAAHALTSTYPRAEDAMKMAKKNDIKLAIVTNSFRDSIERDLPKSMLDLCDTMVTREDVKSGKLKPSGEGLLLALSNLNVDVKNAAYIGDTTVDVYAAKDAGCQSISLTGGMGLKAHLQNANTDLIFDNLYDAVYWLCKK